MKNKRTILWSVLVIFSLAAVIFYLQGNHNGNTPLHQQLGVITLFPLVITVGMSFILKDIVISLFIGLLSGVLIYQATLTCGIAELGVGTIQMLVELIIKTASDPGKAAVLILCAVIGGMVEVIRKSEGFEALASLLGKKINTVRKAGVATSLLGSAIFFDDYANSLIVGPIMRPITDRLQISREKLAYLVDSTAAPVTGIAIISSWVSVEVAVIQEGLNKAGNTASAYGLFLESIPYCFYCLLCLLFIYIGAFMKRDYGKMLQAEVAARKNGKQHSFSSPSLGLVKRKRRIGLVISSVLLFLGISIVGMYYFGMQEAVRQGLLVENEAFSLQRVAIAFGASDTVRLILASAIITSVYAVIYSILCGIQKAEEAVGSWVKGCGDLMLTLIMLVLAWSIASLIEELGTGRYLIEAISVHISWWIIPGMIFAVCCVMSFATGSYGCLFMAMPIAIPLALEVQQLHPNVPEKYLVICIATVIGGAIFGDHCSPITDCTILSSAGSGCDNREHVLTQLPYSMTVAVVSLFCGTLPATLGLPPLFCIIISGLIFIGIFNIFGKNPDIEASRENNL